MDASGNRIPDGAASNAETGEGYSGAHHFSDEQSYQNWLDSAHLYGVQIIVNPGAAPSGPICRWDGRQLQCDVHR